MDNYLYSITAKRNLIRTRVPIGKDAVPMINDIVFPGEYVAVRIVEQLFGSHRSFNYFLCFTKESDIDSRGGSFQFRKCGNTEMLFAVSCSAMWGCVAWIQRRE